jgi:hypothetical protein
MEHLQKAENALDVKATFHQQKHICNDIKLDRQYQQQDFSIKSINVCWFIIPEIAQLPFVVLASPAHTIPLFSCRGGPPHISHNPLRGPPAC